MNSSRKLQLLILGLVFLSTTSFVHSKKDDKSVDQGDDGEANNICNDGTCYCDNIEPFLISCVGNTLDKLYDDDEWLHTIESNNISSKDLDIRLDMNRITRVTKFPKMKIVTLSFQNNWISRIDSYAFAELDDLVTLDLSQNRLTAESLPESVFEGNISDPYYKSIGLQHLNLSHNNIHSIEEDVFDHLPKLTSLDLSNNPIKVLGSTANALASLRSLESLIMANAQLKHIPTALFHDLKHLKYLDLSGNFFTVVPPEILNTHGLEVLILDNNLFESLDKESFDGLSSLRYLSISYIPTLKVIEERTFGTLKNLTLLKCHHNRKLSQISDSAFFKITEDDEHWPVKEIWLNDNALSHVDRELAAWQMVQHIDIQNNPFRCNCDLKWLMQVLVSQIVNTTPHLAKNLKCAEPENLKGSGLVELGMEDGRFDKCKEGVRQLTGAAGFESEVPMDSMHAAGMTVLIIGIILIVIALATLGVVVLIKQRAIEAALNARHEIRYQRADTYDDDNTYRSPTANTAYKVVV